MRTSIYYTSLILACGILFIQCGPPKDPELEAVMDAITDVEAEEQRMEEINKEIETLDEEEQEKFEEQVKADIKKKEEKIAESPLKAYALEPDALIEHLNEKVDEAAKNCAVKKMTEYLAKCGDDPIFKAIYKNPDYEGQIDEVFIRAKKVKDNCKNP
jgi:hypothetical protein